MIPVFTYYAGCNTSFMQFHDYVLEVYIISKVWTLSLAWMNFHGRLDLLDKDLPYFNQYAKVPGQISKDL
jgi:hypothetical protein